MIKKYFFSWSKDNQVQIEGELAPSRQKITGNFTYTALVPQSKDEIAFYALLKQMEEIRIEKNLEEKDLEINPDEWSIYIKDKSGKYVERYNLEEINES